MAFFITKKRKQRGDTRVVLSGFLSIANLGLTGTSSPNTIFLDEVLSHDARTGCSCTTSQI